MPVGVVNKNQVDHKSIEYLEMEPLWQLPDDLLGGTPRMRREAATWLPQKEREGADDWQGRVNASVLFEAYKRALEDLSDKPFEEAITLRAAGELDEFLKPIEADVDRARTSLTSLGKALFREGLHRGVVHVLVDHPRMSPGATLEDRRRSGARPTLVMVEAARLLGWRHTVVDGVEVLSQVRIYEESYENDGDFGKALVQRVRVYERERWQVWRRSNSSDVETTSGADGPPVNPGPDSTITRGRYELESEGTNPLGEVPLVTIYFERAGLLQGRPPLMGLAYLNLAHFQSDSRQRAYLEFARIGTLGLFGISREEMQEGVTWGVNRFIRTDKGPQEAEIKAIEHQGHAIQAGERDLDRLKEEMEALATAPLIRRSSSMTATGEARDEDRGMSRAQKWVRGLETALEDCYALAARWLNTDLPDDFGVEVFSEFGVTLRDASELELLFKLAESGRISALTLLREFKRRGVFPDNFDPDAEVELAVQEGPTLGEMREELAALAGGDEEGGEDGEEGAPDDGDEE